MRPAALCCHSPRALTAHGSLGLSAHTDRVEARPGSASLLRDAADGDFDVVVVHTIDRWARNIRVQSEALQHLGDTHIGFASVAEGLDFTSPSGKLLLTMIGGFSEFFSDQLAVHVSQGPLERAKAGLPVGPVPSGYTVPDIDGVADAATVPVPVEAEAAAVSEAFRRRSEGESHGSIARWLNASRFEPRGKNAVFTSYTVNDMLKLRFYTGVIQYTGQEYPGLHQAVVPEGLFDTVQAMRGKARSRRRVNGPRGLLQGLFSCAQCGNRIHSDRGRGGRPMYRERHGMPCQTADRSVMSGAVDDRVNEIWRAIQFAPEWRARMAELMTEPPGLQDIDALHEKRVRLARAYGDGGYTERRGSPRSTCSCADAPASWVHLFSRQRNFCATCPPFGTARPPNSDDVFWSRYSSRRLSTSMLAGSRGSHRLQRSRPCCEVPWKQQTSRGSR